MPAYGQKVPVMDRWAIVAYIRALQRSQNASPDDLPADALSQLSEDGGPAAKQTGAE